MAVTMLIYPSYLDVESHVSVLRSIEDWKARGESHTVKYRKLDMEHREVEFYYDGSGLTTPPEAWTHVFDNSDGVVYRVTGIRQGPTATTDIKQTSIISLEIDMFATWYCRTISGVPNMDGRWSRLPMQAVVEPFQIRPAQMMRSRTEALPINVPQDNRRHNVNYDIQALWLEYTFIGTDGYYHSAGTFIGLNNFIDIPYTEVVNGTSDQRYSYMNVDTIINDPESYLEVPSGSSVVSIRISPRCPYKVGQNTIGDAVYPVLLDASDNVVKPAKMGHNTAMPSWYAVGYLLTSGTPTELSGEVTLSSDEIAMGQLILYDVTQTQIASIDMRYATWDNVNSVWKLSYTVKTMDNMNTLITVLTLPDGTKLKFPEGTLPYNGSAYQEYAIAQMKYDRELLAINQEKVIADAAMGITGSVVNGAFIAIASGGAGAAAGATGIVGQGVNSYMNYQANERTQKAKEDLMRNTPDTMYNPGYGTWYYRIFDPDAPGFIAVNMPDGVASTEMDDYIARHGYPVTDIPLTVTKTQITAASEGFIQGELTGVLSVYNIIYGEHRRILERQLRSGVHFKVIT